MNTSSKAPTRAPFFRLRRTVISIITLVLIGGAIWLWNDQMERHWKLVPNYQSEARKNNLLVAERLLTQRRYQLKTIPTLSQALPSLPTHGTLMLLDNNGNMSAFQAQDLLRWVKAGNTLILRPKFNFIFTRPTAADAIPSEQDNRNADTGSAANEDTSQPAQAQANDASQSNDDGNRDEEEEQDNEEQVAAPPTTTNTAPHANQLLDDPISSSLGVQLKEVFHSANANQQAPRNPLQPANKNFARYVEFPHQGYPLEIWQGKRRLIATKKALKPIATDNTGEILRLYKMGKGHLVLVADNYFTNQNIAAFDHAEVLLNLAQLQADSKQIFIVREIAPTPWHTLLLQAMPYAFISLTLLLLLVIWRATQRFGPLLPDPRQERRSLLEHIDASAKWLWQSAAGRETLLHASRAAAEKLMQRRIPEISKLPIQQRMTELHADCGIDIKHLQLALLGAVARLPHEYTLQIQTLQKLRQFYER